MNEIQKRWLIHASLLLPLAALCVRFGPRMAGLEWRVSYRGVLNIVTAAALLLWCVLWVVLSGKKPRCLLVLPAAALAALLLFNQLYWPYWEDIIERDGITYIREDNDGGSLANVQYYAYVNELFRGLTSDFAAFRNWGT